MYRLCTSTHIIRFRTLPFPSFPSLPSLPSLLFLPFPSHPFPYLYKMYVFINMVITWVKNGPPDMILTAFERKFDEKKDELPPEVCRPLKQLKKNHVEKEDHQQVEQKQCRTSGPLKSLKN